MSNFALLSDRIAYVLEHYCKNRTELASAAEVTPASVTAWLNGATKKIKGEVALKIARKYGISPDWLVNGTGMPESEPVSVFKGSVDDDPLIEVPEYAVNFGCGPGRLPEYEEEHTVIPRLYHKSWFDAYGLKPEHCVVVRAQGNSMEPKIYDGDSVLVDMSDKERISSGHVYAFMLDNELHIKRLYTNLKGDITIKSDNSEYPPETFARGTTEHNIQILGRVVIRIGSGGL